MKNAEITRTRQDTIYPGANLLTPGTIVGGKYVLKNVVGVGGSSIVYRCYAHGERDKLFAVKILDPAYLSDQSLVSRFRQEMTAAKRVLSPYVVRPVDYLIDDTLIGYVMEFLPGGDLANRLSRTPAMTEQEAVFILTEIAQGLGAIHFAKIVHRDLKPENILFDEKGRAKIADFGVAKLPDTELSTRHGDVLGSVPYISPEYLVHDRFDERSDIYALGVIAYEMITGQLPFAELSTMEALSRRVTEDPLPPREVRRDCSRAMSNLIMKMINRDPGKRFQNVAELLTALEMLADVKAVQETVVLSKPLQGLDLTREEHDDSEDTVVFLEPPVLKSREAGKKISSKSRKNSSGNSTSLALALVVAGALVVGALSKLHSNEAGEVTARELSRPEIVLDVLSESEVGSATVAEEEALEGSMEASSAPLEGPTEFVVSSDMSEEMNSQEKTGEVRSSEEATLNEAITEEPALEEPNGEGVHVVRKGDTIWALARKYGASEKSLQERNGVTDPRQLPVGKVLKF